VISVIRSRRVRHGVDVESMGRTQKTFLWGNVKEEVFLQVLDINGRIMLEKISKK
jgi:hypothetical protein